MEENDDVIKKLNVKASGFSQSENQSSIVQIVLKNFY